MAKPTEAMVILPLHECPLKQRPAKEGGAYANGFVCDGCTVTSSTDGHRWACTLHGFDICVPCVSKALGITNAIPAPPKPQQPILRPTPVIRTPEPELFPDFPMPRPQVSRCGVPLSEQIGGVPCCHDYVKVIVDDLCASTGLELAGRDSLIQQFAERCAEDAMEENLLKAEIAQAIHALVN